MRLRELLLATTVVGCGSVSDNSNMPDAPVDSPDTTPPMIVGSHPAKDSMEAPVIGPITVMFDEPLDPASIGAATVTGRAALKESFVDVLLNSRFESIVRVEGTATYDAAQKKLIFTPFAPLPYNAKIDLTISGIKDAAHNELPAQHLAFDTIANVERYWVYYNPNGTINYYYDFVAKAGKQTAYRYAGGGPGPDNTWFTSDDPVNTHFEVKYDTSGRFVDLQAFGPGTDGILNTPDDVQNADYGISYDAEGRMTSLALANNAGPDMMWHTADDVLAQYIKITWTGDDFIGVVPFNNSGADAVFGTDDDLMSSATSSFARYTYDPQHHRTRQITYQVGADRRVGTPDDTVVQYSDLTVDARGNLTRSQLRTSAGADSMWFTSDDGYGPYQVFTLDANGAPTDVKTFGVGPDNLPNTPDDSQQSHMVNTFDANHLLVETTVYGAGPDGVYGSSDDVTAQVTKYAYTATGARTETRYLNGPGPDGTWKTADDQLYYRLTYDPSF